MKINMKVAFIIALVFHLLVLGALLIKVSLDKPSKPNMGQGDIMHATFVPPAKGNPNGKAAQKKAAPAPAPIEDNKSEELAKKQEEAKAELEKRVQEQKAQEQKRMEELAVKKQEEAKKIQEQKMLALKKAEEAKKKKLEEEKKKLEEKKLEEKKKADEAKKKAEEAKKKAEAEAKKKADEAAKKKAEAEAKAKAAADAKAKAAAEAKAKAEADSLEDDILGTADGDEKNGQGLGSGGGGEAGYGDKVRGLIEQNWRIDPSMNGKKVVVTIKIGNDGMVSGESCQGDEKVCKSALDAITQVGMFPAPPAQCPECSNIKISMTPKL